MELIVDKHGEAIWERKSPRMIMKEARRRFGVLTHDSEFANSATPHVGLASAHYSLVKSYLSHWWQKPLAVWHVWGAVAHAKNAYRLGLENAEQADVVSRILLKAPKRLGGDVELAEKIAGDAIYSPVSPMEPDYILPHTHALLLITLGECRAARGHFVIANLQMDHALQLEPAILAEPDQLMAERQLCRILTSIGVFACEHGYLIDWAKGMRLLNRAYAIALRVSNGQALKISAEINRMDRLKVERMK